MEGWILLLCFAAAGSVTGEQHVLLDTTKESMLDWKRYPFGPNSSTAGWVEESFTKFEKNINWRTYVVCDLSYDNVNNWLWTPFIQRNGANRIYIEIKFSLRNCDLFPGNAVKCKETFSLLYYEFDAATREPPPWEPDSYKLIDRIAADEGRFTKNDEIIINTETRSIDVTHKGLYFAFQDEGACLSLLSVKVYYLTCPEVTVRFARYPETATGSDVGSVEKVVGRCVDNSVVTKRSEQPTNICKGEGLWIFNSGGCACMAGYEANDAAQTCKPCPVGRFKHVTGNDGGCLLCPAHSQALFEGSVECRCNEGYFRSPADPRTADCSRPPTSPRNLKHRFLDASTLRVTWDPPADEGARSDTTYKVECDACSSRVTFDPPSPSHRTRVTLSGLEPGAGYNLRVYATNGVSSMAKVQPDNYADVAISSDQSSASSSRPAAVRIDRVRSASASLSWRPPSDPLVDVDAYEVKYFVRGRAAANTSRLVITKKLTADIKGLLPDVEYGFQVRAQTARGPSDFSAPVYETTKLSDDDDELVYVVGSHDSGGGRQDGFQVRVAIGVIVAVVLVMAAAGVLLLLVKRSVGGSANGWVKSGKDCCNSLDYRGLDAHFAGGGCGAENLVQTHTNAQVPPPPIYNPFSTHKTYVDPHTYEDPHVAIKQFAKEIDSRFITIEAIIGGGEFGDVCRGRLNLPDRNDMLVAIKTLKTGSSDKARMDFLTEASIMGQFEHPNVIFLQGVMTKAQPTMIITEYMENGSLDTFLRANDGKFQVMQLVGMMRGIAYGMQYLAEMNYVHRDLAARNVLVNSQLVCKIADFGLSREIVVDGGGVGGNGNVDADGAYTTRGGKIPVRWTAPEAIAFRKFTSSSDVWSFGIVMWEVMSYGERPYWTWSNQDVIKAIEKGYRLPAPMDCPEAIHQLMLDCWQKERSHRPSFGSIVKTLDKLICCPETLKKIAHSPTPFAPNAPDYSQFASVDEWLHSIKMVRYSGSFRAAGIVSLESVAKLSLQQLVDDLGVKLVGHQKKIMGSVHAMRAQMSINMSEGFLV